MFRHCNTKVFRKNCDTPSNWNKNIQNKKVSETLKLPPRKVSAMLDKRNFDKIVIAFLIEKKFQNQKYSETKKGFSTKWFGTLRQKVFDKIVIASLIEKTFKTRKFENKEKLLYGLFRYCGTKVIQRNIRIPLFLSTIFFDTGKCLKHRRVDSSTKFFCTETKNFQQIHDIPSNWKKFSEPEISEPLQCSSTKFFGTVRQNIFDEIVIRFLLKKISEPEGF